MPCPLSGDLPDPGMEPTPLMCPALAGRFFNTSATWEAIHTLVGYLIISNIDLKTIMLSEKKTDTRDFIMYDYIYAKF